MHAQLGSDDDDGTSAVVDTLSEKVLSEAALLSLEHVGQGLEGSAVGALDGTALSLGVVQQRVHGFLKHSLLVPDDDVGSVQADEALESVVSVDDSSVQVVEVAGCEPSAVKLDHGSEIWRNDGDDREDHPFRAVVAVAEVLDDLDSLEKALVALGAAFLHLLGKGIGEALEIQIRKEDPDGLGAHHCGEGIAVLLACVDVLLFGEKLLVLELGVAGVHDDVFLIVENALESGLGDVQQQAHPRGDAPVVPDVGYRGSQGDVTHSLAAHLCVGDFDTASVADNALVAD